MSRQKKEIVVSICLLHVEITDKVSIEAFITLLQTQAGSSQSRVKRRGLAGFGWGIEGQVWHDWVGWHLERELKKGSSRIFGMPQSRVLWFAACIYAFWILCRGCSETQI